MKLLLILLLIIYVYLKYSQKKEFMNSNKTIWMYWEQGEENLKNEYNKKCIKQWRHLHPTWNVRVLNYDKALELIPDLKKTNHLKVQHRSDYLRLSLLEKYGGVWADASVYPLMKLDDWLESELQHNNIFMYKWDPILQCGPRCTAITCNWFIAVSNPENGVIKKWKHKFEEKMPKKDEKYPYLLFHILLLELYNSDNEVKRHIDKLRYTHDKPYNGKNGAHMWKRQVKKVNEIDSN